jgi:hypothetical protein
MHARLLFLAACGLLVPQAAAADDATKGPDVRPINIADIRPAPGERGNVAMPTEIKSAEELAKAFPDKDAQERIKKEVNFDRERLLFFSWAGSGQDKLTTAVVEDGGKKTAVFTYQPGRTRDLRPHRHLFAVNKGVAWRVAR